MAHAYNASCIDACQDCANACDRCATACLREPDPRPMARCIALDVDCAQVCRLAVGLMARGSAHAPAFCALCALVCESCADECAKHSMDHCRQCAQACQRCAAECRRMAGGVAAGASVQAA